MGQGYKRNLNESYVLNLCPINTKLRLENPFPNWLLTSAYNSITQSPSTLPPLPSLFTPPVSPLHPSLCPSLSISIIRGPSYSSIVWPLNTACYLKRFMLLSWHWLLGKNNVCPELAHWHNASSDVCVLQIQFPIAYANLFHNARGLIELVRFNGVKKRISPLSGRVARPQCIRATWRREIIAFVFTNQNP